MKPELMENYVNNANNEETETACDTEKEGNNRVFDKSLPAQHHDELDKLLQPSDEWSENKLNITKNPHSKYILKLQYYK